MKLTMAFAALVLVGCAVEQTTQPVLVTMPMTAEVARAVSEAKVCENPAVAISKVSAGFRYGCFCGANFPELHHPSGKPSPTLSPKERLELAAQYLNIRPIDDIDAACQAHDVCWVLNGDGVLECNEQLEKSLKDFRGTVEKGHEFDSESLQFRCGWLALDIEYASQAVMEGKSKDSIKEAALYMARFITAPLTVGYAIITEIKRGFNPFPKESERCSVRELAPKISNTAT